MYEKSGARRYFINGMVQGVGFRFFAQRAAERLSISGYVRNLPDGRVEVYAIGPDSSLALLRAALERGPRAASVSEVVEEEAAIDPRFENDFSVERDAW